MARGAARLFGLALLLAALPARAEGPAAAPAPEAVLPPAAALGPGWQAVPEAPATPERDPDLWRWGVRAARTRHYTRVDAPGASRVCTLEVWRFADAARARAAHARLAFPDWRILREGPLVLLLHGVRLELGEPLRRGLFPECHALGERARARAAHLLGG